MRNSNSTPTPMVPTPYLITIVDYRLPYNTHKLYDITIDSNRKIQTLLTSSPDYVDAWFIENLIISVPSPIIGLHIERSQSNSAATLQLCINNFCLVFQIIHSPYVCASLSNYLASPHNRFIGIGIKEDVVKLLEDHGLHLANYVDLRNLAAQVLGDREILRSSELKTFAECLLGKIVEKPQNVSMSRWDSQLLSADQVKYATLDAFVSFEIGRRLYSRQT